MHAWRLFNILLLIALLYAGTAKLLAWPPFSRTERPLVVETIDTTTTPPQGKSAEAPVTPVPTEPIQPEAVSTRQIAN